MYREPSKDLVGRATNVYGQIERTLRKMIEDVFRRHVDDVHPDDWWNSNHIHHGTRDKKGTREIVNGEKAREKKESSENVHPIYYATLGNLFYLIRYKDLWFADALVDRLKRNRFVTIIEELSTERREKIFHQKILPPNFLDVKEIIRLAKDLIPMIRPKYHDALSIEGHKDLPSYIKASWEKVSQEEEEYLYINFPTLEKSFIGRTTEIERIQQSILQYRLVTLHGIGGVGKTSTAIHAVRKAVTGDIITAFSDGFVFIPLDHTEANPDRVLQTVIRAFSNVEKKIKDERTLINFLKSKRCLLLLDNWETVHAPDTGAFLYRLLAETRNLHILVTSQRRIDIEGIEKVEPIDPMPTEGDLESLDAQRLFLERVRSKKRGWKPYDTDALRKILKLTDGIPLLIELVAARAHERTLSQIAQELQESRLRILRRKAEVIPTGPERHASVEACFEWTYQLLPPAVQEFFPSLGVFARGITSEAAAAVSAIENAEPFLDSLHNASLVKFDTKAGRYLLLPLVKEYALEKCGDNLEIYYNLYIEFLTNI